jgi:uncharacterized protein YdhG (YjbR/CyaY superfamily)
MRAKAKVRAKPQTIDEYLTAVSSEKRVALNRLRRTIRGAFPRAEECISYGIPAFRLDGRVVAWFAAAANHLSFFPGGVLDPFKNELKDYQTSKGTVRFQPDHPLPASLVRKLINARIARSAERSAKRPKRVQS